jgi:hypothetical protein
MFRPKIDDGDLPRNRSGCPITKIVVCELAGGKTLL